jgi:hypothetical protein
MSFPLAERVKMRFDVQFFNDLAGDTHFPRVRGREEFPGKPLSWHLVFSHTNSALGYFPSGEY